jgi:hypothetical protein
MAPKDVPPHILPPRAPSPRPAPPPVTAGAELSLGHRCCTKPGWLCNSDAGVGDGGDKNYALGGGLNSGIANSNAFAMPAR